MTGWRWGWNMMFTCEVSCSRTSAMTWTSQCGGKISKESWAGIFWLIDLFFNDSSEHLAECTGWWWWCWWLWWRWRWPSECECSWFWHIWIHVCSQMQPCESKLRYHNILCLTFLIAPSQREMWPKTRSPIRHRAAVSQFLLNQNVGSCARSPAKSHDVRADSEPFWQGYLTWFQDSTADMKQNGEWERKTTKFESVADGFWLYGLTLFQHKSNGMKWNDMIWWMEC